MSGERAESALSTREAIDAAMEFELALRGVPRIVWPYAKVLMREYPERVEFKGPDAYCGCQVWLDITGWTVDWSLTLGREDYPPGYWNHGPSRVFEWCIGVTPPGSAVIPQRLIAALREKGLLSPE